MFRLLSIEFHKMRYNRAAKVLTIIYFALFLSIALIATIHFHIGSLDFQLADQGIFNFPYIWHFNTYFAAILKLFLGFVIIAMIATEYTNRTIKQNLIDGLSKKEFVLSKFYSILTFSLASTVLIFVVSLILGLIFSDYTEASIIFSNMGYLGTYFLKLVAFFSFCFFIGVLVKRAGFAIGALFVWWIFEGIIKGVLMLLTHGGGAYDAIVRFLPLESMANLIKEPFTQLGIVKSASNQLGIIVDANIYWYQIAIALGWTLVFVLLSYQLIKKRDL